MKTLFLLLSCMLFTFSVTAQPPADTAVPIDVVEEVYLAKDDGTGKAGDVVSVFGIGDVPIHCVVQLSSQRVANVKMHLVAVSVPGVKPELKVVTASYTTKAEQNQVYFTGKPDKVWTPGKYRVDIFVDGKLEKKHDFTIEKPAVSNPAVNSFQPRQDPKPRTPKKPRRN